jgi:hypothetical protein
MTTTKHLMDLADDYAEARGADMSNVPVSDEARTALLTAIEEVVKDAQRYQWLRDRDHWPAAFDSHSAPEPVRGTELNTAIDAAIKETK